MKEKSSKKEKIKEKAEKEDQTGLVDSRARVRETMIFNVP